MTNVGMTPQTLAAYSTYELRRFLPPVKKLSILENIDGILVCRKCPFMDTNTEGIDHCRHPAIPKIWRVDRDSVPEIWCPFRGQS
jgi:hypothetical protein